MLNRVKQMLESAIFSNRIAPAWNALSLITKSASNINKFKNLLDRDPNLLMNKLDCDSFFLIFFLRKIVACSYRPNQTAS